MTNVLVAYASKHGSTEEIAEAIAASLRECGLAADCVAAGAVNSLEGYDAVVLGSAVYMRPWRREARRFLHSHASSASGRRPCSVTDGHRARTLADQVDQRAPGLAREHQHRALGAVDEPARDAAEEDAAQRAVAA